MTDEDDEKREDRTVSEGGISRGQRQRHDATGWRGATLVGLVTTVNVLNQCDRFLVAVTADSTRKQLNLSDAELGVLLGAGFSLSYAVFGPVWGYLCDRGGSGQWRPAVLAGGLVVFSVSTAAYGLSQTYTQAAISRFFTGVGEASCAPAATGIIADSFSVRRATVLGIYSMGIYIGVSFAYLFGNVTTMVGAPLWLPYVVLGIIGLTYAIILPVAFRNGLYIPTMESGPVSAANFRRVAVNEVPDNEAKVGVEMTACEEASSPLHEQPGDGDGDGNTEGSRGGVLQDENDNHSMVDIGDINMTPIEEEESSKNGTQGDGKPPLLSVRRRVAVFAVIGIGGAVRFSGGYALGTWMNTFVVRQFGVRTATHLTYIVPAGGLCGTIGGGWLADKLQRRTHAGYLILSAASPVLAIPALCGFLFSDHAITALLCMFIQYVIAESYMGSLLAAVQSVFGPHHHSLAVAVFTLFTSMAGGIGPIVVGLGSDITNHNIRTSLMVTVSLSYACSGVIFGLSALLVLVESRRIEL